MDSANSNKKAVMSFIDELRRRNVFRVGIAYAIATWVLLQITEVITPILDLPGWVPKLIFVILAVGFVPALIFAWAFELTPEGLKKEKNVDRSESITHHTGRKLDFAIIAVLVLTVGLLLADRFSGKPAPDAEQVTNKSIAVLPFVNISSDKEQEYFSDGITEEILNLLASVKELKVAGRTSSFAFKGQNDDLRRIGDLLGVEHILEGSVRKSGATVRITAQLVQVEDGFHLWSDTYDRELTDVFAIQDEIATEILKQLKARLLDEEQQAIVSQRTNPEAYDLYLLAKQRLYERTRPTIESAVELLNRAIAIDPDYAPAYAQRGIATFLLSDRSYGTIPEAEANTQGKRFIDAALEKDPQLAEAWAGLGLYHRSRPAEHEQAIDALTKALSINPNLINASNWLQSTLAETGNPRGALQLLEQMTQRDPLYRPGFANAAYMFDSFGEHEKAQALIDRFRKYDPNNAGLLRADAMHHYSTGNSADGMRLAERAYELEPTNAVTQFAYTVGLWLTMQTERIAEEGSDFAKVGAMELLGRRQEAFDLAGELSREGNLWPLFDLYNRSDRSNELIDYLEERWPALETFAADYPPDEFGYAVMAEVTLAYSRTGDMERFDDALVLLENAMSSLSGQGIDNFWFTVENAKYLALAGEYDDAITQLEHAVDRGFQGYAPIAKFIPMFEPLSDDPRFVAAEAQMIAGINVERQALGLDPIDPLNKRVY
jgi:TolB-like protein/Tfp pilus assembly protein PilF